MKLVPSLSPNLIDVRDVGMIERRRSFGFLAQTFASDPDSRPAQPVKSSTQLCDQASVLRQIHFTHPARA